jgi:hypothetical protein
MPGRRTALGIKGWKRSNAIFTRTCNVKTIFSLRELWRWNARRQPMSAPSIPANNGLPVIAAQSADREIRLQRALIAFIVAGLLFMLLPGTFLGVSNLVSISNRHPLESLSPAWLQAHGHAQIFGWIGTFILGIGFY